MQSQVALFWEAKNERYFNCHQSPCFPPPVLIWPWKTRLSSIIYKGIKYLNNYIYNLMISLTSYLTNSNILGNRAKEGWMNAEGCSLFKVHLPFICL